MAGSFILTLDTTGPDIEITAPSYTTTTAKTDIWVYGSEMLDVYQDFYFIDSQGERHNVIFEYLGDRFHGVVYFTDFPIGITTFYAQAKDEVLNLSRWETASFNIAEQVHFYLETELFVRQAEISTKQQEAVQHVRSREISTDADTREIDTDTFTRRIEVSIRNE